ncbi:alanine racemase [Lachnospira pectinoschiza]|uniref:Alanine racemase n=1 Tax=Lachnospira pectinoschiza TaxID=28052 RepID=A0A1G9WNJ7_9FIRM|nr:alanine racemase [Lachnospira pectinoschiza]SDM85655.1 alanine racemase [Lachnospira pectinoschiza]
MESTLRRTWANINLDAIAYNYKTIKEHIGEDVKFLGVVKADAYGHGSIRVGKLLQDLGANYLAVSSIDEALELRVNDVTMPILILGHTPKEQVDRLIKYNITQAVTCKAKAVEYSAEAVKCGGNLKVHIKVDTGMSRLGYLCDNESFGTGVEGIVEACNMPGLEAEGIFTHFAVADEFGEKNDEYTKHQFKLFTDVITAVEEKLGRKFAIRHCANTGATVRFKETYLDMVRPGLLLYGYGEFAREWGLKPAMTLKTTVSTIKIYPAGTAISYGGIYVTDKKTRIGVLPYGYADGFFRSLSNKCSLMTKEGLAPQRGKICMDMCMIDITDKPLVDVGSEVEIFGENNSLDELAALAGTIPYELTCAVSKRVPRQYIRNGEVVEKELLLRM